jgi:hypothetical protein
MGQNKRKETKRDDRASYLISSKAACKMSKGFSGKKHGKKQKKGK